MSQLRILVVDDHPLVRRALRRVLDKHHVLEAECYDEAALQLAAAPVDLVLSDYRMPGRDGVDVLRTAAQLQPGARRILMSTELPPQVAELVKLGVVHGYHTKPSLAGLLEQIDELASEAAA